jgi:BirA family biotin operon repressor/biotin-[acetyl-CoA-carboxylase] ligase
LYTRLIIGHGIQRFDQASSTNSLTKIILKENSLAEGTVIIADEQSQGRGQYGNSWVTTKNLNLTFSIILYPKHLKAVQQFLLSQTICLGIVHYLKQKTSLPIAIKWPNDILVNEKKICGILIENSLQQVCISESIVGIGLNINEPEFSEQLPHATSLSIVTGQDYNLKAELELLLNSIDKFCLLLWQGKYELINSEYHQHLFRLYKEASYVVNNKTIMGKIIGINTLGQLEVLINNELETFSNKEIAFVYN